MDKIKDVQAWKPLDTETEQYGIQYDKNGDEVSRTSTKTVDYIQWYKEKQ